MASWWCYSWEAHRVNTQCGKFCLKRNWHLWSKLRYQTWCFAYCKQGAAFKIVTYCKVSHKARRCWFIQVLAWVANEMEKILLWVANEIDKLQYANCLLKRSLNLWYVRSRSWHLRFPKEISTFKLWNNRMLAARVGGYWMNDYKLGVMAHW